MPLGTIAASPECRAAGGVHWHTHESSSGHTLGCFSPGAHSLRLSFTYWGAPADDAVGAAAGVAARRLRFVVHGGSSGFCAASSGIDHHPCGQALELAARPAAWYSASLSRGGLSLPARHGGWGCQAASRVRGGRSKSKSTPWLRPSFHPTIVSSSTQPNSLVPKNCTSCVPGAGESGVRAPADVCLVRSSGSRQTRPRPRTHRQGLFCGRPARARDSVDP